MSSVDPQSTIYKRAAGALEPFAAGLRSVIYKRAAGALAVFAVDRLAAIYKRTERAPNAIALPTSI
ncbi:hypothetical protein B9G38_17115 [Halorubrum sp. SD612]|nr:hypothetical protein B9G38_17115 [Halorubrum sp. SD612]